MPALNDNNCLSAAEQSSRDAGITGSSSRIVRSVLVFAIVGTILYGAAVVASDYRAITASLMAFPVFDLVQVIVLVLVGWLIRGVRFHYYLLCSGERIPLGYSIAAFLAGFSLTGTPGKAGEAVKGVFLKEDHGIPVTKTVGILVIERLMDLWGVLLLGSFSFLLFTGWMSLFLLCAGIVLAAGIFLCVEPLYRPILERLGRVSFLSWISQRVLTMLLTGKDLMTVRIFSIGLVMSVLSWGLESISMHIIMKGLGLPGSFLEANFVYCFSTIIGALSMLPGGIGGTEASMMGLMSFMGISYENALPAVILIRVCTLWFAVLVGCMFMVYFLAGTRRNTAVAIH
ncbi:MAG: glycosyltransferase 2 family protein [Thermodesulfobacteriota bacterium]|nr:glycosyltransferase 2 family protein [Thermodesulfobacteriota bacterium]